MPNSPKVVFKVTNDAGNNLARNVFVPMHPTYFVNVSFDTGLLEDGTPYSKVYRKKVAWDFGDGTIIEGEKASHAYSTMGRFTITCTFFDVARRAWKNAFSATITVKDFIPTTILPNADNINNTIPAGKKERICTVKLQTSQFITDKLNVNAWRVFDEDEIPETNIAEIPNEKYAHLLKTYGFYEKKTLHTNDSDRPFHDILVPTKLYTPEWYDIYGYWDKNGNSMTFYTFIVSPYKLTTGYYTINTLYHNTIFRPDSNANSSENFTVSYPKQVYSLSELDPRAVFSGRIAQLELYYKGDEVVDKHNLYLAYDVEGKDIITNIKEGGNYLNIPPSGLVVKTTHNETADWAFTTNGIITNESFGVDIYAEKGLVLGNENQLIVSRYIKTPDSIEPYYIPKDLPVNGYTISGAEVTVIENNGYYDVLRVTPTEDSVSFEQGDNPRQLIFESEEVIPTNTIFCIPTINTFVQKRGSKAHGWAWSYDGVDWLGNIERIEIDGTTFTINSGEMYSDFVQRVSDSQALVDVSVKTGSDLPEWVPDRIKESYYEVLIFTAKNNGENANGITFNVALRDSSYVVESSARCLEGGVNEPSVPTYYKYSWKDSAWVKTAEVLSVPSVTLEKRVDVVDTSKLSLPTEKLVDGDFDTFLKISTAHPMFDNSDNLKEALRLIFTNKNFINYVLTRSTSLLDDTANAQTCFISNLISLYKSMGEDINEYDSSSFDGINELRDFVRILSMNHSELVGCLTPEPVDYSISNVSKGKHVGERVEVTDTIYTNGGLITKLVRDGKEIVLPEKTMLITCEDFSKQTNLVTFAAVKPLNFPTNTFRLNQYEKSWGWNLLLPESFYTTVNNRNDLLNGYYSFYLLKTDRDSTRIGNFLDENTIKPWMQDGDSWSDIWGNNYYLLLKLIFSYLQQR